MAFAAGKDAVVVGGGPCGALTALYLARDGWKVTVAETRDESAASSAAASAEYNVVLNERAFQALHGVGIDIKAHGSAVVVQASVNHRAKDKPPSQRKPLSPGMTSVGRGAIAKVIYDVAKLRYPSAVDWRWGCAATGVDLAANKVTLATGEALPYDVLVVADGVHSPTRGLLVTEAGFRFSQEENENQYKSFTMLAPTPPPGLESTGDWSRSIHSWNSNPKCTIVAAPKPGGELGGVIIMRKGDPEWSWAKMKTPADIQNMFSECFPTAFGGRKVPPEVVEALLTAPPRGGGYTTVCDSLHAGGSVVVIGDAGHSMIPSLGQGCNSALESAAALAAALRESPGGDVPAALAQFSQRRKPDTDAIQRLSTGKSRARFFFEFAVVLLLSKLLPFLVKPPAMMQMGEPSVPFAEIETRLRSERAIVRRFLGTLGAIGVAVFAGTVLRKAWLGV